VQANAIAAPPISYWSAPVAALILVACWSPLAALNSRRLTLF
jgi:hypothetical protein